MFDLCDERGAKEESLIHDGMMASGVRMEVRVTEPFTIGIIGILPNFKYICESVRGVSRMQCSSSEQRRAIKQDMSFEVSRW